MQAKMTNDTGDVVAFHHHHHHWDL